MSRTHYSTRVSRRATGERPPRRALLTKAVRHGGANYEALGVLATVGSGGGLHQDVEALKGQLQHSLLERVRLAELEGERVRDVVPVSRPAF